MECTLLTYGDTETDLHIPCAFTLPTSNENFHNREARDLVRHECQNPFAYLNVQHDTLFA